MSVLTWLEGSWGTSKVFMFHLRQKNPGQENGRHCSKALQAKPQVPGERQACNRLPRNRSEVWGEFLCETGILKSKHGAGRGGRQRYRKPQAYLGKGPHSENTGECPNFQLVLMPGRSASLAVLKESSSTEPIYKTEEVFLLWWFVCFELLESKSISVKTPAKYAKQSLRNRDSSDHTWQGIQSFQK